MDFSIISVAGISLLVVLALALTVRKTFAAGARLPVTSQWIDELSMERYRPMMRLLDGADLQFLRTQPGFNPRMITRLRVQRCQIFRGYLHCLSADFERVCAAIKMLMLQSRRDRPELAAVLVRHQMLFACCLLIAHSRVLLFRMGLGTVDVSELVNIFDLMRRELRTLLPAALPMSA
jgi:hypothetical protein